MKRSRVAKRYAKALFESALEKEQLKTVQNDLSKLDHCYQDLVEFRSFIESPVIGNKAKQDIFTRLFKKELNELTFRFISLLIAKNREPLLPQVIADFHELLDENHGVVRGEVHSAVPLSATQLNNLKTKLDQVTGKDVIIKQMLDESLLGGFVVKIDDKVFDASLRHQLSKLRQNLIEA